MKVFIALVLGTMISLGVGALAGADEPANYNFATAQGSKQISAPPGGEGRGIIYFYNVDGNRITHVGLDIASAPSGWEVHIEPARREVEVNVSGQIVKVSENLHVEPSQLLAEETKDVPQDMVCIPVPGRGYALAKVAYVLVKVPASEKLGAKGDIKVSAEASWLGQTGAAAIKQARDFDFAVEVAVQPDKFTETIVGEVGKGEPSAANASAGEGLIALIDRWSPTILAGLIVLLGIILVPRLGARKREQK